jgi:hypothetical protein
MDEIPLWLGQYTDDFGKRRLTRYRLTEEEARARLVDPVKVEASPRDQEAERVDRRVFAISPPKSWPVGTSNAPGSSFACSHLPAGG